MMQLTTSLRLKTQVSNPLVQVQKNVLKLYNFISYNQLERHKKIMKIRFIQHRCNADHLLLEHNQSIFYQLRLDIESALLNFDKDSAVNVPVCNYNTNDQHLN